jgi:oxygen-independent coproporphyrinogen-3 oxidase
LITALKHEFDAADDVEVTLEANPENLTAKRCRKWHKAGITRLSIGAQSFQERDLKNLERLHEARTIYSAVANAREADFGNISLDLMFALPGQTMEEWESNLEQAAELRPQHISFYGLTYHEKTPFEEWRRAGKLEEVGEDLQAAMYRHGSEYLAAHGYEHYEISNFALPGWRSRHNQRYWTRRDVIGLGPGAHTNLGSERWSNPDDIDAWAASISRGELPRRRVEELDAESAAEEKLFTGLRRTEGIVRSESPRLYDACRRWSAEAGAEADPLIHIDEHHARLTLDGWLLSDAIIGQINPLISNHASPDTL